MNTATIYGVIGFIHTIGLILFLANVKFVLKKTTSTYKLMIVYIFAFLFVLTVISTYISVSSNIPYDLIATIGELTGLAIAFFLYDSVLIAIGKWLKKSMTKSNPC